MERFQNQTVSNVIQKSAADEISMYVGMYANNILLLLFKLMFIKND